MLLPIESCKLCGLETYEKNKPSFKPEHKTIFVLPWPVDTKLPHIISQYGDIIWEHFCMNGYVEVCSVYFNMIIQTNKYKNLVARIDYLRKIYGGRQFEEYNIENIAGVKIIPVNSGFLDKRVMEEIK